MKQKITPNLWFDGNAQEAAEFYVAGFPEGKILSTSHYPNSVEEGLADFQIPLAGQPLTIDFSLGGQRFTAINAGPEFRINPSISFMLNFDPSIDSHARDHLDALWEQLMESGQALMPLDSYPFSPYFGWVKDRFGTTWQLILTDPAGEPRPFIIPALLFADKETNLAEEALHFYVSVFEGAKVGSLVHYPEGSEPNQPGSLMFGDFMLADQWFAAMDSGIEHGFTFNEAISFAVECQDQAEIDAFWEKLSSDTMFEQCGWCKDRFGVSWQIIPENIEALMKKSGAYTHLMEMKKIVIADF